RPSRRDRARRPRAVAVHPLLALHAPPDRRARRVRAAVEKGGRIAAGELTLRIEALSYGVFGVARTEEGVVLVPDVAPGDVLRARVVAREKRHREAEVVEIVSPSPARRAAPCPHLPECGGCSWQHVDYAAQLAAKEAILRETLARVGGFD